MKIFKYYGVSKAKRSDMASWAHPIRGYHDTPAIYWIRIFKLSEP